MSKVLLIYEDYSEMNTLLFSLKKVGFDSVGITTEFSVSEQIISFNPDIVVACGKGPKVSSVSVGRRLKDMPRWNGKAVLIFPVGFKPRAEDLIKIRMDMVLEAPVPTVRLIQVLAKLTSQDDQILLEKLIKSNEQNSAGGSPQGGPPGSGDRDIDHFYVGGNGPAAAEDPTFVSSFPSGTVAAAPASPHFPLTASTTEIPVEKQKVDWEAVENQLFGSDTASAAATEITKGSPLFPLAEKKSVTSVPAAQAATPSPPGSAADQVATAKNVLSAKMQKYNSLNQGLKLKPESTMKRTASKKAQKELKKGWSEEELKAQDDLRREFTKALFKKK